MCIVGNIQPNYSSFGSYMVGTISKLESRERYYLHMGQTKSYVFFPTIPGMKLCIP